jgi:hypothetical protein
MAVEHAASSDASLFNLIVGDHVAVVYDDKWFPGMARLMSNLGWSSLYEFDSSSVLVH